MSAQNVRFSSRIFIRLTVVLLASLALFSVGGLAFFDHACRVRALTAASAAETVLKLGGLAQDSVPPTPSELELILSQAAGRPGPAAGAARDSGALWARYWSRTWLVRWAQAWRLEWNTWAESGRRASVQALPAPTVRVLPEAAVRELAALQGLVSLAGYERKSAQVFSWHAVPSGAIDAAADLQALASGPSAPGVRFLPEDARRGVWRYRIARRVHDAGAGDWEILARFDCSPELAYDAIPALAAGWLVIGLLYLGAAWLLHRQIQRLSRGLYGLEETLKGVFQGENGLLFEAREFALTQHVANLLNQLVYFFRQDREARELAYQRDALTGLYTRGYLMDMLGKEIQRTKRYARPLSFIMGDIDHFKRCNDTYGHPMGDMVLARTAAILQEHTRETDIVGRYGGEEIAIILSETPLKHAVLVAEKLRRLVEASRVTLGEQAIQVTISLGVTSFLGGEADTVEAIVARADKALYDAKQGGRNQVRRRI